MAPSPETDVVASLFPTLNGIVQLPHEMILTILFHTSIDLFKQLWPVLREQIYLNPDLIDVFIPFMFMYDTFEALFKGMIEMCMVRDAELLRELSVYFNTKEKCVEAVSQLSEAVGYGSRVPEKLNGDVYDPRDNIVLDVWVPLWMLEDSYDNWRKALRSRFIGINDGTNMGGQIRYPLVEAAKQSLIDLVKLFLLAGADINQRDTDGSIHFCLIFKFLDNAFMWACYYPDEEVVRLFLNSGSIIDVNARDNYGSELYFFIFFYFFNMN